MTALLLAAVLAAGLDPDVPDTSHPPPPSFAVSNSDDPNSGRYFWGLSAVPMKRGTGYLSLKEGMVPVVSYAPTDWLSLRLATFAPLWLASPAWGANGMISARASFQIGPTTYFAAGAGVTAGPALLAPGHPSFLEAVGGFGFAAMTVLLADGRAQLTFTGGANLSATGAHPYASVAGSWRLAEHLSIVTENLFVEGGDLTANTFAPVFSGGLRVFGESLSLDLALAAVPPGTNGPGFALPFVDVTWNFGP